MKIKAWLQKNTHSLVGKTVAVSGATGGIGKQLCLYLAELGASLVLINRNDERAKKLGEEIFSRFPDTKIEYITADMEDIDSVRRAADELLEKPIDVLFLNAGAYAIPRHKCSTGYDNVFQINFVSPYYLGRRLLPKIRERGGRIVAVGSIAHRYSKTDASDVDFSTRKKASLVYGNSKRYLMTALGALAKREGEIVIVHPGITYTNITAHYPKIIFAIIKHPMKVVFMSVKKAALSILSGAFWSTSGGEWIGPRIFDVWGLPKIKRFNISHSERDRIIADSEQIFKNLK